MDMNRQQDHGAKCPTPAVCYKRHNHVESELCQRIAPRGSG